MNHSAEILQKSNFPVPKAEVTHEPEFLHAQTAEAATHRQGMQEQKVTGWERRQITRNNFWKLIDLDLIWSSTALNSCSCPFLLAHWNILLRSNLPFFTFKMKGTCACDLQCTDKAHCASYQCPAQTPMHRAGNRDLGSCRRWKECSLPARKHNPGCFYNSSLPLFSPNPRSSGPVQQKEPVLVKFWPITGGFWKSVLNNSREFFEKVLIIQLVRLQWRAWIYVWLEKPSASSSWGETMDRGMRWKITALRHGIPE